MRRLLSAMLAAVALLIGSGAAHGQTTAADSAWERGDMDAAERLYSVRLAADSNDVVALRRIAQLRAWAGKYSESIALSDRVLRLSPDDQVAALDRARVLAWARRFDEAVSAVDEILARDPTNRAALEARAQFTSWSGRYDESLRDYGQLLEIAPGDPAALQAQARVLGWARRYEAAAASYERLLQASPNDRDLLLGLAQVLSWGGRTDSAAVIFRRLLETDPRDLDALKGLARAASWSGKLRQGERYWRQTLLLAPNDVEALIGLGATLRWQGRDAAALEVLRRAQTLEPTNADLPLQLMHAEAALAPRAAPSYTYESDSDDNEMQTTSASLSFHPTSRLEVRGAGYRREMTGPGLIGDTRESTSYGGTFGGSLQLEPGWTFSASVGASQVENSDNDPLTTVRGSVSTPRWFPLASTVTYARGAFDHTALLAQRRVRTEQFAVDANARLSPRWHASGGAATTLFTGQEDNRRMSGNVGLTYRVLRPVTFGIAARAFTFEKDRTQLLAPEGYFSPDFYGIVEATGSVYQELGGLAITVEIAPGLQQIGEDGEANGSFRGTGRLAYTLRPGRQIGVSAAFANSGLQSFSPGADADYRYQAFGAFFSWAF